MLLFASTWIAQFAIILHKLQGEQPSQVYDMVLAEMEKPLLSVVLEYTRGNQTRAAEILGLNRGTFYVKS